MHIAVHVETVPWLEQSVDMLELIVSQVRELKLGNSTQATIGSHNVCSFPSEERVFLILSAYREGQINCQKHITRSFATGDVGAYVRYRLLSV